MKFVLADQESAQAVQQISGLIGAIQNDVKKTLLGKLIKTLFSHKEAENGQTSTAKKCLDLLIKLRLKLKQFRVCG